MLPEPRPLLSPTSGTSGTLYWKGTGSDTLDESDLSGNQLEEYVYFNGQRVARRDLPSNAIHYYFSDHLGTHGVIENATATIWQANIRAQRLVEPLVLSSPSRLMRVP